MACHRSCNFGGIERDILLTEWFVSETTRLNTATIWKEINVTHSLLGSNDWQICVNDVDIFSISRIQSDFRISVSLIWGSWI